MTAYTVYLRRLPANGNIKMDRPQVYALEQVGTR
jgi:hypothetical protein